jgi:hypothetical protein
MIYLYLNNKYTGFSFKWNEEGCENLDLILQHIKLRKGDRVSLDDYQKEIITYPISSVEIKNAKKDVKTLGRDLIHYVDIAFLAIN